MITEQVAKEQIQRLIGLDGFPRAKELEDARHELVRALQESAQSEEHARLTVTEWLSDCSFCPRPAELGALAESINPSPIISRSCEKCKDGWIVVFGLKTWHSSDNYTSERITESQYRELLGKVEGLGKQAVYSAVMPCPHCRRDS